MKGKKDRKQFYKNNKKSGKLYKKKKIDANDGINQGDGTIRLNKYLAQAGIASRREADKLIKIGAVSVNGKVITEMGFKV